MNKLSKYTYIAICGISLLYIVSCKKNNLVVDQDVVPPAFAKFNTIKDADTIATYFIKSTNNTYKLPIGVTTVSNVDRTINFTYTSTAAVQGTQFNAPNSIVIKAGQTLDSLTISGLFAGYPSSSRKDTVIITISGGDVPASAYKGRYKLILRKYCEVVLTDLLGDYKNTNELFGSSAYGPYTTSISSVNQTSPTSGTIVVENLWDYGWNSITFNVNWSDPNPDKFTIKVVPQSSGIADAGTIGGAYDGMEVAVREYTGETGSLNMCEQRLVLKFQLGYVTPTGPVFFNPLYQVTMVR